MEENRMSLEIIASSVEDAITQGLEELGLSEDQVEIEVMDIGSEGLFGLGSREARVKLTVKSDDGSAAADTESDAQQIEDEDDFIELEDEIVVEEAALEDMTSPVEEELDMASIESEEVELGESGVQFLPGIPDDVVLHVARETVNELLDRMNVAANVDASFGIPDDEQSRTPLNVDITGNDLSILIGPHAETLNALQYISNMIIGKELGRSVPLVVDVEGFRKRRTEQLQRLANTMAEQAVNNIAGYFN